MKKTIRFTIASMLFLFSSLFAGETKEVLDMQVDNTISTLFKQAPGAREFLNRSAGYLVIPNLYKAGFIVGGEYGEGALFIKVVAANPGDTADTPVTDTRFNIAAYYSMTSASVGFQAGAQKRSLVIVFLTEQALENFLKKNSWKVGVDGSVAFVDIGASADLSTVAADKSIVAFAFGNQGLMAGVSIDGSVFTKIKK